MSIWERAARLAKANLNDLARRAASMGKGKPLDELSDEELAAELERRRVEGAARAARRDGEEGPSRASSPPRPSDVGGPPFLAALSPQKRRELRQFYANLELPFGASLEDVKHAYRRLMRQYHPDKFPDDPARRQLATQLSQKLTKAYNELIHILREAEGS